MEILAVEYDLLPSKDKWGGTAKVAVDEDGEVQGFVWALTSEESELAYIEYFCVRKDLRDETIGAALQLHLFTKLIKMKKRIVYGLLLKDNPYSKSLAHTYSSVGMKVADGAYSLSGDTAEILKGIARRKDYGRINENDKDRVTGSHT